MKQGKRSLCILLVCLILLAMCPIHTFAAEPIQPDRKATLNISYKDGEKAIPNARFSIYKVADIDGSVNTTLTENFEAYQSTVSGLSDLDHLTHDQWLTLASSLKGYVLNDGLTPTAEGRTDSDGNLSFSDLEVGLYLVIGSQITADDDYTYSAVPFMVFLPSEDSGNNDWNYDVTAAPKSTKDYNPPEEDDYVSRRVLKKWDDAGYETLRPTEVVVQLLCDGKIASEITDNTVTLSEANNWRYAWDNLNADYEWEVIEKEVEGYAVTITRSGITFTVINKYVVPIIGTNIPIQKRITGDTPETNSTFTFVFSANDASFPMPKGSNGTVKELTIAGVGSKEIGEITFEKPGTYVYTVKEKNGGVEGYSYDSTVYTVTYEVVEKDGELSVTRTIKDDKGNVSSAIEFTNPYKTPGENLPQTGLLWWPVPILLCVGLVCVMIGVIRRRKCN